MIILLRIHFFPQHRTLQGNTESWLTKSATMCQSHPLSSKGRASWRSVQSGLPQHSIDGAHIITPFHKPSLTPHLQQNGVLLRGLRYANLRAKLAAERHHSQCSSHCCLCVLHSAQWHVEAACRAGQSSVCSRGNPLLAAPSTLNHWCHRPAIPTSVHNQTKKVSWPYDNWVKWKQVLTNQSRAN